jgi:PBP1b-binding outer membrane lipoprotein LpoB
MKKLFMVMAAAAFLTACNNSADTAADMKDSIDSAANVKTEAIDSTADAKIEKIDSTAEAKKEVIDSAKKD